MLGKGLTQEEFLQDMTKHFGSFNLLWIIEDENSQFKSGRGQISLVGIRTDGWVFEPMIYFFRWATEENILRAMVAFFHMLRYQKDVGVCMVRAIENERTADGARWASAWDHNGSSWRDSPPEPLHARNEGIN